MCHVCKIIDDYFPEKKCDKQCGPEVLNLYGTLFFITPALKPEDEIIQMG